MLAFVGIIDPFLFPFVRHCCHSSSTWAPPLERDTRNTSKCHPWRVACYSCNGDVNGVCFTCLRCHTLACMCNIHYGHQCIDINLYIRVYLFLVCLTRLRWHTLVYISNVCYGQECIGMSISTCMFVCLFGQQYIGIHWCLFLFIWFLFLACYALTYIHACFSTLYILYWPSIITYSNMYVYVQVK